MGMKLPTILKGDTAAAITITLASNYDFSEATLEATYQGVVKTFSGLVPGGSVSLVYSAEETSAFATKTDFVRFRLLKGEMIYTLPLSVKVKVTDCPAAVNTGVVTIAPVTLPSEASAGDSLGELKVKFNAILSALRAGATFAAIAIVFNTTHGAKVEWSTLNNIGGTNDVVTAIDLSDLVTPHMVSNIVNKGYVESLDINIGLDADTIKSLIDVEIGGTNDVHDLIRNMPNKAELSDVNELRDTVALWQGYWYGDDFRVAITNYDSHTHMPTLYMEDKISDEGSNYFRRVWSEKTRWECFTGANFDWSIWTGFYTWYTNINTEINQKADRAWGYYDSHSGTWSPEGYMQISSPHIMISSGMAYQRTITTDGSIWVLTSNGLTTQTGGTTNGFFRVSDDEGNSMLEIIKGDKHEVGADAGSTSITQSGGYTIMTVTYAVTSDDHPKMYYATELGDSTWYAEDDELCPVNTSWSGSSGAWMVSFHYKSLALDPRQLFAKAGYMVGGETIIKHSVPAQMQSLIINGQKYRLGTATISGNLVITLISEP